MGLTEIGFVLHKNCPGAPKFSDDSALTGKKVVFDGVFWNDGNLGILLMSDAVVCRLLSDVCYLMSIVYEL